jgi:hypothetical protein
MLVCAAISREFTVEPPPESEVLQVYLYGEAMTDIEAFLGVVAAEKARDAELVDVTLTAISGKPALVLTFHCASHC